MTWNPSRFNIFPTIPAPRCTSQRLPHLLRLLLMYQDNPIPASASGNFSNEIVHAPAIPHFGRFSDSGDCFPSSRLRLARSKAERRISNVVGARLWQPLELFAKGFANAF